MNTTRKSRTKQRLWIPSQTKMHHIWDKLVRNSFWPTLCQTCSCVFQVAWSWRSWWAHRRNQDRTTFWIPRKRTPTLHLVLFTSFFSRAKPLNCRGLNWYKLLPKLNYERMWRKGWMRMAPLSHTAKARACRSSTAKWRVHAAGKKGLRLGQSTVSLRFISLEELTLSKV